jgi:anti-sigma B factor antagonist
MAVRVGSRGARRPSVGQPRSMRHIGPHVVSVMGEVDVATAPALEQTLLGVADAHADDVIVDLTGCSFLDSQGLSALIEARGRLKRSNRRLALVLSDPRVLKIFEITRFNEPFEIHASLGVAVERHGDRTPGWRERESETQARSRKDNESTARAGASAPADGRMSAFRCECGDEACTCVIRLTVAEYESVRGYATHFAIARDHENPELEQLIEEHERFAVVESVSGESAKHARRSYPRQWQAQAGVHVLPRRSDRK